MSVVENWDTDDMLRLVRNVAKVVKANRDERYASPADAMAAIEKVFEDLDDEDVEYLMEMS